MNISLEQKRRQEEARLAALVLEIAAEEGHDPDDRPHRGSPTGDRAKMRGVPMIVRGGIGSAMRGTVPGSDEHLDQLE